VYHSFHANTKQKQAPPVCHKTKSYLISFPFTKNTCKNQSTVLQPRVLGCYLTQLETIKWTAKPHIAPIDMFVTSFTLTISKASQPSCSSVCGSNCLAVVPLHLHSTLSLPSNLSTQHPKPTAAAHLCNVTGTEQQPVLDIAGKVLQLEALALSMLMTAATCISISTQFMHIDMNVDQQQIQPTQITCRAEVHNKSITALKIANSPRQPWPATDLMSPAVTQQWVEQHHAVHESIHIQQSLQLLVEPQQ
jgi:hypothetical protein